MDVASYEADKNCSLGGSFGREKMMQTVSCPLLSIRYNMVYSGLCECNEYNPL